MSILGNTCLYIKREFEKAVHKDFSLKQKLLFETKNTSLAHDFVQIKV